MTSLDAWAIEYEMSLALEGKPISTLADRMWAYEKAGLDLTSLSQDEIWAADQDAYTIQLSKRIAK
jgi:hypothetical protein